MRKKVLFIGRLPPPVHGAALMNERYVEDPVFKRTFEVRKIKINDSDTIKELGKVNIKKFFGFFKSLAKTVKELSFFRPEVIYFEIAPRGFAFYRDSIFVLICKLFNKRIVFQFHAKGIKNSVKGKLSKNYYKFIFNKSEAILLSKLIYPDVKEAIRKNQTRYISNGLYDELNEGSFKEIIKKRNRNKKTILLFLSNMIESKGPLDVLNICNELKNNNVRFECLFLGNFQDKEFEERFFKKIKKLNLKRECKYLGAKYGKEKYKILEKTNYLIFPTTYTEETSPAVILESFMFGIPVLSYDNGAIKELISKNYLGLVDRKGNWENLYKELMRRKSKRENASKIREYFKNNYTFKKSRDKLIEILK